VSRDRFSQVRAIFIEAARHSGDDRRRLLDEACGDDGELRSEVEELLRFHEAENISLPDQQPVVPLAIEDEQRIGGYRLLRPLGEGGMGEVFEAEQVEPVRRRVAVKLIKWGMDTREVVARFESERQALALMNHPNIARVFGAGATAKGRPYFVMELVKGIPITDYCDTHRLTTEERLELFIQVCSGIQHAHQKGIIHRDMKPSNVLVAVADGEPAPKIIDFGVAKATSQRLTEQTVFTELGQWIGTPEYMSPEQAEMSGLDIDTRTDVYSLGVLLYELLAGSLPFEPSQLRGAGLDEVRRAIREQEPIRPSTRVSSCKETQTVTADRRRTDPANLVRTLRGDLDWITLKALDKDRTRRYGSAAEMAADITRFLSCEPVLASPPGSLYRLGKLVRRNRAAVIAAVLILAAGLAGIIGTSIGLLRARREAAAAHRVSGFMVDMYADLNPNIMRGQAATAEAILDRAVERVEEGLEDEPLVQARLLATLGHVFKERGQYLRARPLLERSAQIRRLHLGDKHPDYAMSISFLGDLLREMGELENARRLHEQALTLRQEVLGPDHLTVGWSLRSLGNIYRVQKEYDTARSLLQQSVKILEQAVGKNHFDTSVTLHIQALMAMEEGDLEGARPILERCLTIREQQLDPDHPELAVCLVDYARLLYWQGERGQPTEMT
jgi:serine/threonine protein kinase